jgi:hypothetical protein
VIDWSILRPTQKGLAVEGQDDKLLVEAFLNAGEQQGLWQNWRSKLVVETTKEPSGFNGVLRELSEDPGRDPIWGLIDRDWHTDTEISDLTSTHPHLLVLPRRMIENYCIDPDDFLPMLPKVQRDKLNEVELRTHIQDRLSDWVRHGALSAILYENGADTFCGRFGYPRGLLSIAGIEDDKIFTTLQSWHHQLEPNALLNNYQRRVVEYQQRTLQEHYRECLNGKVFFTQMIVLPFLNPTFGQQKEDAWFKTLMRSCTNCPSDFAPLMSRLL